LPVTLNSKRRLAVAVLAGAVCIAVTTVAAVPAHAEEAQWEAGAAVVSTEQHDDGTVTETIYTPAEDLSPAALAAHLTATGVANVRVRTEDEVSAQAAACKNGTARTWPSTATCFVKWSKNGAARPVIDFVDYSGTDWPVGRAVTEWNKTSGIDSIYRTAGAGCDGAPAHCVNVYSGNYGRTGWVGLATRTLNAAQTYHKKVSVKFNTYYTSNAAQRWNVACHELGHALGLHHNLSTSSCLYYKQSAVKYPTGQDRALLERFY
jgi:hypothetical protein